jgi:hypothetical protein
VSARVLAVFNCVTVDGVSYLVADTTVLCSGEQYDTFSAVAGAAVLVFPIGIPLLTLALLLRFRGRMQDREVRPWLGFVSESYFELLDMACKLLL